MRVVNLSLEFFDSFYSIMQISLLKIAIVPQEIGIESGLFQIVFG